MQLVEWDEAILKFKARFSHTDNQVRSFIFYRLLCVLQVAFKWVLQESNF